MIEYRRITPADIESVTHFALAVMPQEDRLRVSVEKVRAMVAQFAGSPQHFNAAAFDGRLCVAALAAWVAEMPFHARCEAHVMFCFSRLPGAGMQLLKAMMRWAGLDHRVQRVLWSQNAGFDERLAAVLARRFGFKTEDRTVNFIFYKAA